MELSILEAMQREEVMTKYWDCKLMFKEEEDTQEIDLLDYVNLTEQEEDKIPNNLSYPNLCLYKFPDRFNGLGDWQKLNKELHSSGITGGCTLISNHAKSLAVGKKFHVTCHRYRTYKEKVNLKIKYDNGSDDMDGIATTTVKQNRLIETRGTTGPKQSRKTQTFLPTCNEKKCHFGFNVNCRSSDGGWFLSKSG
jgi:hypothetical protein